MAWDKMGAVAPSGRGESWGWGGKCWKDGMADISKPTHSFLMSNHLRFMGVDFGVGISLCVGIQVPPKPPNRCLACFLPEAPHLVANL